MDQDSAVGLKQYRTVEWFVDQDLGFRRVQWTETVVASASPSPSASASSKQASALFATGSSAWREAANCTAVARSFLAAVMPKAVSPSGAPPSTLAITAPRPFMAAGAPAVSERISISRSGGRLSGLPMVRDSPRACH